MGDDRFALCLPYTLAQECPFPADWSNPHNFSDDAHDPGGATQCGIIQREYDAYRKSKGLPVQSVRKITAAEGEEIYRASYWLPECAKLPAGLDLCYFDAAVNEGASEAVRILQTTLGIANDGEWGPLTEAAVTHIGDIRSAIERFTARRETVYRQMRGYRYFGRDWERRSAQIEAAAMKMVSP